MPEIVYKSQNAVVIYKEPGMPSQSDPSADPDAMTLTSRQLHAEREPSELWLVHRLDRVVGGLLVFARNKKSAAALSEAVQNRLLTKEYLAVVDGEAQDAALSDYLYKDSRMSRSFVINSERNGAKLAKLSYRALAVKDTEKGKKTLIKITLETGRFHQIRAQLSHAGHPVTGDGKYGSRDSGARFIALSASRLCADIPGEKIDVQRLPAITEYPWSLFTHEEYEV